MRPKDLKRPFTWQERRYVIIDKIFYIPKLCTADNFCFPGWLSEETFSADQPIYMELCSGNGDWVVEKALQMPHLNWIAVEKKFDRVQKIWSKMKNYAVSNLMIVCADARVFAKEFLAQNQLTNIFINFPDPWPKNSHAKHRLVQRVYLSLLAEKLKLEGGLTLVTDDENYANFFVKEISSVSMMRPDHDYKSDLSVYGSSYFGTMWQEMGRTIKTLKYIKKS